MCVTGSGTRRGAARRGRTSATGGSSMAMARGPGVRVGVGIGARVGVRVGMVVYVISNDDRWLGRNCSRWFDCWRDTWGSRATVLGTRSGVRPPCGNDKTIRFGVGVQEARIVNPGLRPSSIARRVDIADTHSRPTRRGSPTMSISDLCIRVVVGRVSTTHDDDEVLPNINVLPK